MNPQTRGLVLRSIRYGEQDAILTVLTETLGKISIYASRARKLNSPLRAVVQPFGHSLFFLKSSFTQKSTMWRLQKAELIESFYKISQNPDQYFLASYFTEVADKLLVDERPEPLFYQLLVKSLGLLEKNPDLAYLRLLFDLYALEAVGSKPEVLKCTNCGNNSVEKYIRFSISEGGVVCSDCTAQMRGLYKLDPASVRFLQYIYSQDIEVAQSAHLAVALQRQLRHLTDLYMLEHLGNVQFRSLAFIQPTSGGKNHDHIGKN